MRTVRSAIGVALFLGFGASATLGAERNVVLAVKPVPTKDDRVRKKEMGTERKWTDGGNSRMTWVSPRMMDFLYTTQTIEINVRNAGGSDETFEVQSLFIEEDLEKKTRKQCKLDTESVTLAPGATKKVTSTSPTSKCSMDPVYVNDQATRSGVRQCGYVVMLCDTGGAFKVAASKEWEKLAKDPQKLKKLVDGKAVTP